MTPAESIAAALEAARRSAAAEAQAQPPGFPVGQRVVHVHDDYHHPLSKPMLGTIWKSPWAWADPLASVALVWDGNDARPHSWQLASLRPVTADEEAQVWLDWKVRVDAKERADATKAAVWQTSRRELRDLLSPMGLPSEVIEADTEDEELAILSDAVNERDRWIARVSALVRELMP